MKAKIANPRFFYFPASKEAKSYERVSFEIAYTIESSLPDNLAVG